MMVPELFLPKQPPAEITAIRDFRKLVLHLASMGLRSTDLEWVPGQEPLHDRCTKAFFAIARRRIYIT